MIALVAVTGCATVEVTGFDDVEMSAAGYWVREVDPSGEPQSQGFWVTSDPGLDCPTIRGMLGSYDPPSEEIQALLKRAYRADDPGEECRITSAYYEALDLHLGDREDYLLSARLTFAGDGLPPVGVPLRRAPGALPGNADWEGSWGSIWDETRWMLARLDCEAAERGAPWEVEPSPSAAGRMRGVVTMNETGRGYAGDLALGLESFEGGLHGAIEGRVRFEPCDIPSSGGVTTGVGR